MVKQILLSCLLLSGCSILFYEESYILKEKASWVDDKGKKASNEDFGYCIEKADLYVAKNKVSNESSLDKFYRRYPILGECLYKKGYIFQIKSFKYCYNQKRECEAFKPYIRWGW